MGDLLKKIAPKLGARVLIEPEWKIVGQIIYKSGRKRYFRYSSLDLNTLGASEVARDKGYATFFMKRMGYRTIPGQTFFSTMWAKTVGSARDMDAAYKYAQSTGFPVIVKPNGGSQGRGVSLVHSRREFYSAMRRIFTMDRIAIVQTPVVGKDYRVVVLDDKIISAYQRIPLNIVGDGKSSIRVLLSRKQRSFKAEGRDTQLQLNDPRIREKLVQQKYTFASVPSRGERVFLLDNANLSTGGDAVDVTDVVHPQFRKLAIKLTKDMGLRLCGVDLMIDGDISKAPKKYWVIEINAAPGLDHYVKTGKTQQKIVETMYLQVLKHMERK